MTELSLNERMKTYYENRSKTYLARRTPVILRLDGRAFHQFTRGFKKPYDRILHKAMQDTLKYLCQNIQGCKIGYTQSDEISLLLLDTDNLNTDAWFDYSVQKLCSVSASMATVAFYKTLQHLISKTVEEMDASESLTDEEEAYRNNLLRISTKMPMFDARCFNIPAEEVNNYFLSRQQDATRNSVQMLAQTLYSANELNGKSSIELLEMLAEDHDIIFSELPTEVKRGVCCVYQQTPCTDRKCGYKSAWVIDTEIPVFYKDKEYIEKHLAPKTNE